MEALVNIKGFEAIKAAVEENQTYVQMGPSTETRSIEVASMDELAERIKEFSSHMMKSEVIGRIECSFKSDPRQVLLIVVKPRMPQIMTNLYWKIVVSQPQGVETEKGYSVHILHSGGGLTFCAASLRLEESKAQNFGRFSKMITPMFSPSGVYRPKVD